MWPKHNDQQHGPSKQRMTWEKQTRRNPDSWNPPHVQSRVLLGLRIMRTPAFKPVHAKNSMGTPQNSLPNGRRLMPRRVFMCQLGVKQAVIENSIRTPLLWGFLHKTSGSSRAFSLQAENPQVTVNKAR